MDRGTFDALMQETLRNRAEQISMPESRKEQIYQAIADRRQESRQGNRRVVNGRKELWQAGQPASGCRKEEEFMKKRGTCKILVAAAALCIMGTMAVMAAGKIVGYSSSHSVDEADFAAYGDLAQVDEKAGFPVKAPEKFENGYTFEQGYLVDVNAHDENGEVLETFPKVSVYYKKGGESLTLCVERVRPERQEAKTGNPRQIQHGDITMTYCEDHYRFVPPDYQITREEQEAVDAGELYISYGTSEVEDTVMCSLVWNDGDVYYLLQNSGTALNMDAMVEMGRQVIDSPEL